MTFPASPFSATLLPNSGEGDNFMPAKAVLVSGKHWYVQINHQGQSRYLTSWRNKKFNEEVARFVESIVNQQILSKHFIWSDWFARDRKKYTWKEVYRAWSESKTRAPATRNNIKYKYQHFQHMENADVRDLKRNDFLWIKEKYGETQKAKAIRQVAQALLNWALKTELRDRPIFLPEIQLPHKKTPYLPLETRWAIYHAMQPPYNDPMMFGFDLGMRIGEICALQWEDIDWKGEGITVCHTMSAYILKQGRKEDDEIWIPFTPNVKEILIRLREERPAISGYVFTHASGKQIWTQQLSAEFKSACRTVGVPNSKFHHLRHSFLHDLSEAGATTREAGALVGHKVEHSTENYIGRWSKEKVRSIAHLRNGKISP